MAHHRAGLARLTRRTHGADLAERLLDDWRGAPVSEAERAMLAYAEKLTLTPGAMREDDLAALRAAGLSDRAILEVNLVVAYFAYANRLADGLGVMLEPQHVDATEPEGEG